ncbi:hypothetical protein B296_00030907 [Ensete ventricosum]|uniref:Uncharacterized protein n=1 Tax=Ensete ventricosum TaxID=4639 RepID=A0A426Z8M9_ENSVE|nr:hypothetical protein B296_00030907 [Ensete ventricosum]
MGLYSDSNGVSIPESLIFFITYHTAAPHHVVRGPCDEAHAYRLAFPCRIGHVGWPVVRGHEDVMAKSIFVISFTPLLRLPIRVMKIKSCAEPSVCSDVRLVLKVD